MKKNISWGFSLYSLCITHCWFQRMWNIFLYTWGSLHINLKNCSFVALEKSKEFPYYMYTFLCKTENHCFDPSLTTGLLVLKKRRRKHPSRLHCILTSFGFSGSMVLEDFSNISAYLYYSLIVPSSFRKFETPFALFVEISPVIQNVNSLPWFNKSLKCAFRKYPYFILRYTDRQGP